MDDHAYESDATADDDLAYDDDEADAPAEDVPQCAACGRPLEEAYYTVNGVVLCEPCRDVVLDGWRGGSRLARFARAGVFGAGAAVAGFALYFGVLKLTGLEIGLISILVGLMVGRAVRAGANGRGGWAYQGLAMFLTYTAIVASYTAVVAPQMFADIARRQGQAKGEAPKAAPARPARAVKAAAVKPAVPPVRAPKARPPSLARLLVALVVLVALLYALPIVAGFHQPIGLLIISFALWEAWKINRAPRLDVTGPHPLDATLPAGA